MKIEPQTDQSPTVASVDSSNGKPSNALAARIAAERAKLAAEEMNEAALGNERTALLTSGSDDETDAVELAIDKSRSAQLRSVERIALLEKHFTSAKEQEVAADLDTIADTANAARVHGEQLIRQRYAKEAGMLAKTLRELQVADALVAQCNDRLTRAGRAAIPTSNQIRCTAPTQVESTSRRTVSPHESDHPQHSDVHYVVSDQSKAPRAVSKTTQLPILPAEIDVTVTRAIPGRQPYPVTDDVSLPGAIDSTPLWQVSPLQGMRRNVDQGAIDALLAELGSATTKPKSSWLKPRQ